MDKKIVFSYFVTFLFLALIIVFFDVGRVAAIISSFDVFLFAVTVFLQALSYPFRAMAWKITVDHFSRVSFRESFYITCIGFLANFVLPLRIGELVRAFLLSEVKKIPKSVALSTVVLNRLVEVVILIVFFIAGLAFFPFVGPEIKNAVFFLGFFLALTFLVFIFHKKIFKALGPLGIAKVIPKKIKDTSKNLLAAGNSLASVKDTLLVIGFSLVVWIIHALVYFLIAREFGLELGVGQLLLIVSFTSLSALIPSSPGFVGTLQAAFVAIFLALGLDPEIGLSTSIIAHLGAYIAVILLGVFSSKSLGFSVWSVFSKAQKSIK